jgi:enoyl-CoA hydratase/carnithine racemase
LSSLTGTVDLEFDSDGVAVITLRRPPLNVFDLSMRDALLEAVVAVGVAPDVRVLVLQGSGEHFSAGADLSEFGSAASPLESRRIRWDRDVWTPLWTLPVPVLAALKGYALGAGLEMAMLSDLRFAAPSTTVGLPEIRFGMLPAAGGTQSFTKLVGPDAALPPLLLGRVYDAGDALAAGLVHHVVTDVEAFTLDAARRLATCDERAVRRTKRLIRDALDLPSRRARSYDGGRRP